MVKCRAVAIADTHANLPQKLDPNLQPRSNEKEAGSEPSNPTSQLPAGCVKLPTSQIRGIRRTSLAVLCNRRTPIFGLYLKGRFLFSLPDPRIRRYRKQLHASSFQSRILEARTEMRPNLILEGALKGKNPLPPCLLTLGCTFVTRHSQSHTLTN